MDDLFAKVKSIRTSELFRAFFPGVELKPDGPERFKINCIFKGHADATASLTIYPGSIWCYSCGKGGSNIDLAMLAGLASTPLETARLIVEKFDIEAKSNGRNLPAVKMTIGAYANYVGLPVDFIRDRFRLEEIPDGIAIPYLDENETKTGVQIRHRLASRVGSCVNTLIRRCDDYEISFRGRAGTFQL
jgi:hypothetical protein